MDIGHRLHVSGIVVNVEKVKVQALPAAFRPCKRQHRKQSACDGSYRDRSPPARRPQSLFECVLLNRGGFRNNKWEAYWLI